MTNISDITKNLLNWVSWACWVEKKNSCRGKIDSVTSSTAVNNYVCLSGLFS